MEGFIMVMTHEAELVLLAVWSSNRGTQVRGAFCLDAPASACGRMVSLDQWPYALIRPGGCMV